MESTTLGARLTEFSRVAYRTHKDFAIALGIFPSAFGRYIADTRLPSPEVLAKMYELGLNINWLLTGKEDMYAHNEPGDALRIKNTGQLRKIVVDGSNKQLETKVLELEAMIKQVMQAMQEA